jgi:protein involved in polysaccharide export with SLBB domain
LVVWAFCCLAGCETKGWLDPTSVGRWEKRSPKDPLEVKILPTLGVAVEEPNYEGFSNATEVGPEDLVAPTGDYAIGRADLINISISDLSTTGVETVVQKRVSETGKISLPLIGLIPASGLTEAELEQVIAKGYRDKGFIQEAQVAVTIVEYRARTFSIQGAVVYPGEYAIYKSDFTLLDAMVMSRSTESGGPASRAQYIYVIRRLQPPGGGPSTAPLPAPPDILEPHAQAARGAKRSGIAWLQSEGAEAPATQPAAIGGERTAIGPEGRPIVVGPEESGTGATLPAPSTQPSTPGMMPPASAPSVGFEGFKELKEPENVRIIRIPVGDLKKGELKYDIIIRPGDRIIVPLPVSGEYYMGGHVGRPGAYSLSDRKIILKQAIWAAGGFDPIAIPARTEIIRRLPGDREVFVRVNLDKIFAGQQPDLVLKPDDIVNVGTNAVAPFIAAARGAFRLTYGFGFLYDRNFADNNNMDPLSR